jgi:hypothetical protein
MPDWLSHLEIFQSTMFPMIPYRHLGLLASTNRSLAAAINKIGRNFTFINRAFEPFGQHEFTIYNLEGEKLMIRTRHPYTPAILFKLDDKWYDGILSKMKKGVPYNPDNSTQDMPLVLYKAGCKILDVPSARNETRIWFLKTRMSKVEHEGKLIDSIRLTLFLGCNLGKEGPTVSSAYMTYLMDEGRIVAK